MKCGTSVGSSVSIHFQWNSIKIIRIVFEIRLENNIWLRLMFDGGDLLVKGLSHQLVGHRFHSCSTYLALNNRLAALASMQTVYIKADDINLCLISVLFRNFNITNV